MGAQQKEEAGYVDLTLRRLDCTTRQVRVFVPNAIDLRLLGDSVEEIDGVGADVEFVRHDGSLLGRTGASRGVTALELRALHDLAEIRVIGSNLRAVLRERRAA